MYKNRQQQKKQAERSEEWVINKKKIKKCKTESSSESIKKRPKFREIFSDSNRLSLLHTSCSRIFALFRVCAL